MAKKLYIFILLTLCSIIASAQDAGGNQAIITHYGVEDGLMDHTVSYGIQDSFGYIWFGTHNGLVRFDGYRFVTYKAVPGDCSPLASNRIDYLEEQADHDILCLSQHVWFIFHRSDGTFERIGEETEEKKHVYEVDEAIRKSISQLKEFGDIDYKLRLVDRQGGIWVRSSRGLERVVFRRKPVSNMKFALEEGEEPVRGLMVDRRKRLWVADKNNYVRILSDGKQEVLYLSPTGRLTPVKTKFGHTVFAFFEDSRGRIWMGTKPDGLFLLSPDAAARDADAYTLRQFVSDPKDSYSISGQSFYSIVEDGQHRIWAGSYGGGLNLVEEDRQGNIRFINQNNRMKHYPREEGRYVRCMQLLGNVMLIGTTDGLLSTRLASRAEDMTFFVNQRDSADATTLSNNTVMAIETDSRGRVFLATHGGGICMAESGSVLSDHIPFRNLAARNGLSSDVCLNVYRDCNQQMWVESEYTLSQIDADEGTFTNYQRSLFDGGFLFTECKPVCMDNGDLVFGTSQGILRFGLDEIRKSQFVPRIVCEMKRGDYGEHLCPDTLDLSPDEKVFTIRFAALDYNKNEQIIYAYKLEGIDEDWRYTTGNEIQYTSFPAGTYRLHIRSTNGDGMWVDNERVITIHRHAAFNETHYAWMLYGGLLILLLWLVWRTVSYIRQLQKEMSDYKLSATEKMEYMASRMEELMSSKNNEQHLLPADMVEDDEQQDSDTMFRERALQYIQQHVGDFDLSIDAFAEEMNVSRSLFYLRTKKVFGMSPKNIILQIRMEYAQQLLAKPGAVVAEVALQCGYSDPKYFSRCFKNATGKAPSEWKAANG